MSTKKSKNEEIVLTAEDQRKIEHGKWLGRISKKAKNDKARREFMENDDDEIREYFFSKFKSENFSYLPYVLYPLAGVSTLALIVMMFTRKSPNDHTQSNVREEPKTEKKKYETLLVNKISNCKTIRNHFQRKSL